MLITPAILESLRRRIDVALEPVAAEFGLALSCGKPSQVSTSFPLQVQIAGATSPEVELYERNYLFLRLPPINTEFTQRGVVYILRGMKPRAKNCILIERKRDGRELVCSPDFVPHSGNGPTMTLGEFVKAVNTLDKDECKRINAGGGLFGAQHISLPEVMLKHYHEKGLTPAETLAEIRAEVEAEGRAEAAAS